jgi:hypothetical protein
MCPGACNRLLAKDVPVIFMFFMWLIFMVFVFLWSSLGRILVLYGVARLIVSGARCFIGGRKFRPQAVGCGGWHLPGRVNQSLSHVFC